MYESWYDYVKPKNGKNVRLCYMDTNSFNVHIKQKIYVEILQKMLKQGLTLRILN